MNELWPVIPTRGRPAEIEAQVGRLIPQLRGGEHVVVVVDGCPDTLLAERKGLRVVRLADGVGVDRARAIGNALVPCEAGILEIDDHDPVEPDIMGEMREALADNEAVAAYADVREHLEWEADGKKQELTKVRKKPSGRRLAETGFLGFGCRAYKRWAYDAVGGYPLDSFPCNDYKLLLMLEQVFGQAAFRHVAKPLLTVECGGGISGEHKDAQRKKVVQLANVALNGGFPVPFERVKQPGFSQPEGPDLRRIRRIQFSIVTIVRNRLEHLQRSVPKMLAQRGIRHVIAVDYGSSDGSLEWLRSVKDTRLVVVECLGAKDAPWSNAIPINTGARVAYHLGANCIATVDADIILAPEWAETCGYLLASGGGLVKADRVYPGCSWTGTMAARAEIWERTGGHDERITGWGWHDSDFANRAAAIGQVRVYPHGMVEHIPHGDEARADKSQYEANKARQPLRAGEQPWATAGWQKSKWPQERLRITGHGRERKYGGGLLYVFSGDEYRRFAEWSALSARLWNPGIEIAVVGADIPGTLRIKSPASKGYGARGWKTRIAELTPFERTVFLDADTVVCGRLEPLFRALGDYDIAVAPDHACDFREVRHLDGPDIRLVQAEVGAEWPQFNSGVIAFSPAGAETLKAWPEEWIRGGGTKDQGAFARVLAKAKPRILPLGRQWNGPRDGSYIWHRFCEHRGKGDPRRIVEDVADLESRLSRMNYMRGQFEEA